MSETQMWAQVAPALIKAGVHAERMPSGGYGASSEGLPDVAWHHAETDRSGWLELKFVRSFAKAGRERTVLPWTSPAQPLFLRRWAAAGGRAAVLLCAGTSWTDWFLWQAPRGDPSETVAWLRDMQTNACWALPFYHIAGRLSAGDDNRRDTLTTQGDKLAFALAKWDGEVRYIGQQRRPDAALYLEEPREYGL